jgi:hypothetical protein
MFFFCHVFAGMILGISVSRAPPRMRMAVGIAVLGSFLPDLVDKPLAHFVFAGPANLGQIPGHILIGCLIILAVALVVYRRYHDRLVFLLPAGVFLHQAMDLAWLDPVTWLYPVLGPLTPCNCAEGNYVATESLAEVSSLSEWIFLLVIIVLSALLFHELVARWTGHDPAPAARRLLPAAIVLLVLMGLVAAVSGTLDIPTILEAGTDYPAGYLMLAAVSLIGAVMLDENRGRLLNPA